MLIFTNRPFFKLSVAGFSFADLPGMALLGSDAGLAELVLARCFLNDRTGGQPTTGAGAALKKISNSQDWKKRKHKSTKGTCKFISKAADKEVTKRTISSLFQNVDESKGINTHRDMSKRYSTHKSHKSIRHKTHTVPKNPPYT
uniref:Uncharacterized protein n=1 Tax=Opuntia streptacantha TaxID=393608 RepID=A0A7C9ASH2_OPUST